MYITWEDRKAKGTVENQDIAIKPVFSFDYAWFLIDENSTQFVETHTEGVWNKDLSEDQVSEVMAFYSAFVFTGIQPEFDELTEKLVEQGTEAIDGKMYTVWGKVPLSPEETTEAEMALQQRVTDGAQNRLDTFAKTRNYEGILSAASYSVSNNPRFTQDGLRAVELRDATWEALYVILDEIRAGTRPVPTGFESIVDDLPVLSW